MKTRHWFASAFAVVLLTSFAAQAQEHDRFDDHDRQVTQDWYRQHEHHQYRGLRAEDRLNAEQEARLEEGRPLDRELLRHAYTAPSDLRHHLPAPPRHHEYMVLGGHVILVDQHHVVRGVIHLHD